MDVPIVFGRHDNLVGVVSGLSDRKVGSDIGVVMLTPGMLHHAGPYRLHVELAQALADIGMPSLRFDLSGIGESLAVGSAHCSLDRAADESRQAMDVLSDEFGIQRFVLFGLCSGADDSLHTALRDPRVIGLAMMDGFGYPTKRFYRRRIASHYIPRLLNWHKWQSIVRRTLGLTTQVPNSLRVGDDIREFPDRDEAAQQLRRLIERDVKLHLIYTGGVGEYYNYAEQYQDMFSDVRFDGNVSSAFFSEMDHVAMLREDRDRLIAEIVGWVDRAFGCDDGQDLPAVDSLDQSCSHAARLHSGSRTIVR